MASADEEPLSPATNGGALLRRRPHFHSTSRAHTPLLLFRSDASFAEERSLLVETDMPAWYQHTPYILTGYRRIQHSYTGCFESLLYLHNESVNFYTHCLGAIAFTALHLYTRFTLLDPHGATRSDHIVFGIFHLSAVVCLSFSAQFHLFCCHSQKVQRACMKCDYVGIVVLIVGSMFCSIYYGFYCYPTMQMMYMAMTAVAGLVTIFVNTSESFVGPKYRPLRTFLFISIGLLGLIPMAHALLVLDDSFSILLRSISATNLALESVAYIGGAMLFLFHIPEAWYPGFFDYWFQSHQIFHVAVLLGAAFHHAGLVDVFLWRKGFDDESMGCAVRVQA
ncbi:hemolysin-III related-domain-containing protein [Chytriomyces sp. MP71]|nr:hemolysin-III related-domain-containing protein [Chytriomyces sp. MP71]